MSTRMRPLPLSPPRWLRTPPHALQQRSFEPELLDAEDIDREALWQNLRELELINHRLGGYAPTLKGLSALMAGAERSRCWHILDVGCGGGDTLAVIADWAKAKQIRVKLSGVDLLPDCIAYAKAHQAHHDIAWHACAYEEYGLDDTDTPDIIISSLFCHHLDTAQFQHFLRWTKTSARLGFVINDLHRHPLAYYGIGVLTHLLSRSELVKNDAALSVWRGFSRQELRTALAQAGLRAQIHWDWAFRWRVMGLI